MQEDPNEPGEKTTHMKSAALQYREIFADDRHAALVEVLKRTFWELPLEISCDHTSDIASLLIAACATPGTGRPSCTTDDASPTTNTPVTS